MKTTSILDKVKELIVAIEINKRADSTIPLQYINKELKELKSWVKEGIIEKRETKKIDYYGTEDNYIHLKFGDARKCYHFTEEFEREYPEFADEYKRYWNYEENCIFDNVTDIVNYVFHKKIPVHFYFNYTDTPAESKEEIINWINNNQ